MRERRREHALFVKVRGGEEAVELRGIHYKRLHHADSDTHSLTNTNIWDENDEKNWRGEEAVSQVFHMSRRQL